MNPLTSSSPTHEKVIALEEIKTAIRALEQSCASLSLVNDRSLGHYNTALAIKYSVKAIEDLRVYEKQLTKQITGE